MGATQSLQKENIDQTSSYHSKNERISSLISSIEKVTNFNHIEKTCYVLICSNKRVFISFNQPTQSLICNYERKVNSKVKKIYKSNVKNNHNYEDSLNIANNIENFEIIFNSNNLKNNIIENIDSLFNINKRIIVRSSIENIGKNKILSAEEKKVVETSKDLFFNEDTNEKVYVIKKIISMENNYANTQSEMESYNTNTSSNRQDDISEQGDFLDIKLMKDLDDKNASENMKKLSSIMQNTSKSYTRTISRRRFVKDENA